MSVVSDMGCIHLLFVFCCCISQRYNASRYADPPTAISQSYDDLTDRIEQALRISSSGLSTDCNTDQSMVLLQFTYLLTVKMN